MQMKVDEIESSSWLTHIINKDERAVIPVIF